MATGRTWRCGANHTKYQPKMPDEWKCPKCGVGLETGNEPGFVVDEPDANASDECSLNHADDVLRCNACDYGCSGAAFARRLQKAANMVDCPHCKGRGLVSKVEG